MILPAKDVAIFYTCFRIALFTGFEIAAINALLTPIYPQHGYGQAKRGSKAYPQSGRPAQT
jgi:hypothetical protein